MKKIFTYLFSVKNVALLLLFCMPVLCRAQVLFYQDFSSSTTVSTYVGTGANQFDFIGLNGTGGSSVYVSASGVNANKLSMQRNTNNIAFVKSTDLAPVGPSVLKLKFKLSVPFGTAQASGTAATFYVGSGLTPDAVSSGELPLNASRHSMLGMTIAGSGMFYLRDLVPFSNSPVYTGEQVVTWIINNSDASINYTDPAGGSTYLGNDSSDVWVGTTRVVFTIPASGVTNTSIRAVAAGAANPLTDFKFLFSSANGNSAIAIDELEVSTGNGSGPLPINLLSFNGAVTKDGVKLNWVTAKETNNKYFEIKRAGKDGQFTSIAKINGNTNSQVNSYYNVLDGAPLAGTNFYQLSQVDLDGKTTVFKTISVNNRAVPKALQLLSSTANEITIAVSLSENKTGYITYTDMMGRVLYSRNAALVAGENIIKIPFNHTSRQVGVVSFVTTSERMTMKVL